MVTEVPDQHVDAFPMELLGSGVNLLNLGKQLLVLVFKRAGRVVLLKAADPILVLLNALQQVTTLCLQCGPLRLVLLFGCAIHLEVCTIRRVLMIHCGSVCGVHDLMPYGCLNPA